MPGQERRRGVFRGGWISLRLRRMRWLVDVVVVVVGVCVVGVVDVVVVRRGKKD